MFLKSNLFVLIFTFSAFLTQSQNVSFIECDYSFKSYISDDNQKLVLGKIFFNCLTKELILQNSFPVNDCIYLHDTTLMQYKNDTLINKLTIPDLMKYSIFEMAIEGTLINFGLKNSDFEVSDVYFSENKLITTWTLADKNAEIAKIITSNSDNKLDGMILFDKKGNITNKYFFDYYITNNGISLPCEIIRITYSENTEYYEITNFKNHIFNSPETFNIFDFYKPK